MHLDREKSALLCSRCGANRQVLLAESALARMGLFVTPSAGDAS